MINALFSHLMFVEQVTSTDVAMADGFRSEGKIYVLVAIILTILAGLIFYLFRIDRKISRLEKEIPQKTG
jgi:hypothetical protein